MRLHAVDDLPFHQVPTPFNVVGTSDVHFNDGYWFAAYARATGTSSPGCGCTRTGNVIDGFAASPAHNKQRVCAPRGRCGRATPSSTSGRCASTIVGPMQRDAADAGRVPAASASSSTSRPAGPPFLEAPLPPPEVRPGHQRHRSATRRCAGHRTCAATGTSVAVDGWHAMRDHSWGMRSTMGAAHAARRAPTAIESEADRAATGCGCRSRAGDHGGFFNTHEDEDGAPAGLRGPADLAGRPHRRAHRVRHEIEYGPGTRTSPAAASCSATSTARGASTS